MATTIPEAYSQLLEKLQNNLVSKTEMIDYTPMSASTLKSAIAKALRPNYDKAIETRNKTAATNRAKIDADAAARGIGASTWVTDVKNRQNDAAAADIANLEGDYASQLYQNLLSRLTDQENRKLTVDQFNAQAKQNALAQALSLTDKYWEKWKTQPASGGGGSSSSKKIGTEKITSSYDRDDWFEADVGSDGQRNLKNNTAEGVAEILKATGGKKNMGFAKDEDGNTRLVYKDTGKFVM